MRSFYKIKRVWIPKINLFDVKYKFDNARNGTTFKATDCFDKQNFSSPIKIFKSQRVKEFFYKKNKIYKIKNVFLIKAEKNIEN